MIGYWSGYAITFRGFSLLYFRTVALNPGIIIIIIMLVQVVYSMFEKETFHDQLSSWLTWSRYIYIYTYTQGVPEFFEQNLTKCSLQLYKHIELH